MVITANRMAIGKAVVFTLWLTISAAACAEEGPAPSPQVAQLPDEKRKETPAQWHYGAYLDLSYALNFNFPENHLFRSKLTTPRTNELAPNMALAYLRKDISEASRWGMELAVQGGYDTYGQVPDVTPRRDRPYPGADTLRHISRANMSYLAPIGNGLTLTAGLFNSIIGFESFYAKDNFNYTRSFIGDYSPYFMAGFLARYPINEDVTVAFGAINGYNYLSHPNDVLRYTGQMAWKASKHVTVTQNLYYGPDQADTDIRFWRAFSGSILQWAGEDLVIALAYDIGTERMVEQRDSPRTFWTGSALFTRWHIAGPWAIAVRPEVYWDRNGRLTGSEQFIRSVTSTLEQSPFFPKPIRFSASNIATIIRPAGRADSLKEEKSVRE